MSNTRAAAVGAWLRLLLCVVARGFLALLVCLGMWAILPDLLGWHTVVVMTGSMEPRVRPGDALVYQPRTAAGLRPGQVIIVNDPTHPGRLLSHRMEKRMSNHELITRGDANASADSTPVEPDAVLGLARLRVQYVGLPWKWLHEDRPGLAFGAFALFVAAIAGAGADPDGPRQMPRKRLLHFWALWPASRMAFSLAPVLALLASFSPVFSTFTRTTVNSANSFAAAATFCTSPSTTTLNANRAAWIDQGNPSAPGNVTSGGTLAVQSKSGGQNNRTLVKFPALPTLPAGCRVTSATLALKSTAGTNGRTLQALRATSSWTASSATWNLQPSTAAPSGTATAPSTSTASATASFTVTTEVQAMYGSSAFGFMVRDKTESDTGGALQTFSGGTVTTLKVVIG